MSSHRAEHGRTLRRRVAVVTASVLALTVLPALGTPRGEAVTATVNRADVGSQQPSLPWESPSRMNADLDAIVAAGMTWVRTDFYWSAIELQRGTFSWAATDAFVRASRARGLRVLAMPDYTPAWARSGPTDKYPPRNPVDYATFVGKLAARYAPMGVHAWEIWNEPNLSVFWAPRADPVAYTRLLKLAHAAIKRVDPLATVVSGGLAPAISNGNSVAPLAFIASMYAQGGRGSFEALGYHPYSYPYPPMYPADWNTFYRTPAVHALMVKYGDGAKRIWGTEAGYPTGTSPQAVSTSVQATYITAAIKQWTSWSFHGPLFVFSIRDYSTDRRQADANMGLLYSSGAPKPVFWAVQRLLRPRHRKP